MSSLILNFFTALKNFFSYSPFSTFGTLRKDTVMRVSYIQDWSTYQHRCVTVAKEVSSGKPVPVSKKLYSFHQFMKLIPMQTIKRHKLHLQSSRWNQIPRKCCASSHNRGLIYGESARQFNQPRRVGLSFKANEIGNSFTAKHSVATAFQSSKQDYRLGLVYMLLI